LISQEKSTFSKLGKPTAVVRMNTESRWEIDVRLPASMGDLEIPVEGLGTRDELASLRMLFSDRGSRL
jgi:hypothetical protein